MSSSVRTIRLGIDDLVADEYVRVPFEISSGDESVEVTFSYDTSLAVIDLGCEAPHGWRGWSGGARSSFVIRPDAATPGYAAGELERGQWHVILGLYRMPAEPIEVSVTISVPAVSEIPAEASAAPLANAPRASARMLPAAHGLTWFAGDFHAHTTHSDGDRSIAQLAALAVGNGLDFLAVTDHNTVSHHPLLPAVGAAHDITLLPGQEVTTRRGHANAFGDIGWIDFREHPDRWVSETAARGGILSINHPLDGEWAWQHALTTLPAALEFWHIGWFRDLTATAMWALWPGWRQDAILLGGSDYHNPTLGYQPGTPVTWVAAEDRSTEAIMAAVAAGRTAITRLPAPDAPALVRVDGDLVAVAAEGTVLVDIDGRRRVIRSDRETFAARRAAQGPYRLEGSDRGLLAVSP